MSPRPGNRKARLTLDRLVRAALAEDVGPGDLTTRLTVPADRVSKALLVARAPGVLCGLDVFAKVMHAVSPRVRVKPLQRDGAAFRDGEILARVSGPTRPILTAERTALNFLQRLSGIATLTREYVAAVRGTRAVILDTRKTLPGWRELEKRAVRCGGGENHRMGLYDMVLVKDNHLAAAGSIPAALEACRSAGKPVEIEVTDIPGLREALDAGATRILLDNMDPHRMRRAVELARGKAKLEASGNINLRRVRAVAETGVDFISVGAITHSAPAADIALDLLSGR